MKRILVTGASGFLGPHCLAALAARGWNDIHAVSRTARSAADVTWHACDLLNPGAVSKLMRSARPTHALHLAWCTTPGEYWTSPDNLLWITASIALLEEFARAGGVRFVGAGTCAEYEWSHGSVCSETATPLAPQSPYGAAKHALQLLVSRLGSVLGLSTAWGRIFFPYGPYEHQERLVAYVIRSLLAGAPALCTSGDQIRDFIYAGDVAEAFAVLLESNFNGPVNIASGEPVAVKAVVGEIALQLGKTNLIRFGARTIPATEPAILTADVRRLQTELGWQRRATLSAGITASIAYWANAWHKDRFNGLGVG